MAAEAIDGDRMRRAVEALARPRMIATAGHAEATEWVEGQLRKVGLDPRRQPLTASRVPIVVVPKALATVVVMAAVVAALVYDSAPHVGVAVLLVPLALTVAVSCSWMGFARGFDWGRRLAASNVWAELGPEDPTHTAVLVAHYDSKSQTFCSAATVLALLVGVLGLVALLVASALRWADASLSIGRGGLLAIAAVVVAAAATRYVNRMGNASPGALDNASGVAVVLELARLLAADPPKHLRVVFLATDAEEIGMAGALRFVEENPAGLDVGRTSVVNFDAVGRGEALRLAGARRSRVRDELVQVAREQVLPVRGMPLVIGAGLDHMPIAHAGYDAVSLLGEVLGKVGWWLHSHRDTLDHVDPTALALAARLTLAWVRWRDEQVVPSPGERHA